MTCTIETFAFNLRKNSKAYYHYVQQLKRPRLEIGVR